MNIRKANSSNSKQSGRLSARLSIFLKCTMLAVALRSFQKGLQKQGVIAEHAPGNLLLRSTFATSKAHRRVQVQIVHRHGDRTPITPLNDESYWTKQLIAENTLKKIASNTNIIAAKEANTHGANGRGPFGKLTELGLLQLVKLGGKLREDFVGEKDIFNAEKPLAPQHIRVISTNFLRTIQSVQGLLVGLFPDGTKEKISIDARHTNIMIPDPQPRSTLEQASLEEELAARPEIRDREKELLPLAIQATKALHDMLAPDAREADFGVAQDHPSETSIEVEPLSWNQLAEITKCLAVRDLLPANLSKENQEAIIQHAAWRWFQAFRHPRLAHLAMGRMTGQMVAYFENHAQEPPLTVWSAHDSTLICLMCAFRLEQPAVWPDYGSYLMLELLEDELSKEMSVRFSLNGQVLKSEWGQGDGALAELIPLATLAEKIHSQATVTAVKSS